MRKDGKVAPLFSGRINHYAAKNMPWVLGRLDSFQETTTVITETSRYNTCQNCLERTTTTVTLAPLTLENLRIPYGLLIVV